MRKSGERKITEAEKALYQARQEAWREEERKALEEMDRTAYKSRCGNPQGWKILSVWGEETSLEFWGTEEYQPLGGMLIRLEDGTPVFITVFDGSREKFWTAYSFTVQAPGWVWVVDDTATQTQEELEAIMASCSNVLGIDAWDVVKTAELSLRQIELR